MRRLRLKVSYDGTDFAGWQRQLGQPTVQEELERVVERMTGTATRLTGAGRTDAGVHALGQVAHFDTEAAIPVRGFRLGMNSLLPRSIAVLEMAEAPPDFNARLSARRKLYRYRILNRDTRAPLDDRYHWNFYRPLDVDRMQRAARQLEGEHDFAAFRAADCERKTTVRKLDRLSVERSGDEIVIEALGPGFLKNMVRILAGTLVDVGYGRLAPKDVAEIRDSGDRTRAGQTAPARGLTLVRVEYDGDGS